MTSSATKIYVAHETAMISACHRDDLVVDSRPHEGQTMQCCSIAERDQSIGGSALGKRWNEFRIDVDMK